MSDLELETGNTAEIQTELVATPHDLGPDHLKDFVGAHILEVKPGTTLLNSADRPGTNNFGGIFGRGVATGVGVHGVSTSGHGIRGEGQIGVIGFSSKTGFAATAGQHTGQDGFGVVGDGTGTAAGVLGRNGDSNGHGVRGEGGIGVFGTSSTPGFAAIAGSHSNKGFGVVGDTFGGLAGVLGRNSVGEGVRGEGLFGVVGASSQTVVEPGANSGAGVSGLHTGSGNGVSGQAIDSSAAGVAGSNPNGPGVLGIGQTGVSGLSSSPGFAATAGRHTGQDGFGVVGDGTGSAAGVFGRNSHTDGHGVRGEGGIGVFGTSSTPGFAAVAGSHSNKGFGVVGDVVGVSADTAGVLGRNDLGDGVRGVGSPGVSGICTASGGESFPDGFLAGVRGNSTTGPGVFGVGVFGGQFKGTSAQLSLVPAATTGRPTSGSHAKGEILMDNAGALFVCIADGTPGSWVKISTTPA